MLIDPDDSEKKSVVAQNVGIYLTKFYIEQLMFPRVGAREKKLKTYLRNFSIKLTIKFSIKKITSVPLWYIKMANVLI